MTTPQELKERYDALYDYMAGSRDPKNMKALQQQSAQLADLRHHQQTFSEDFLSNIIGNATWDGAVWLVRRLARLI